MEHSFGMMQPPPPTTNTNYLVANGERLKFICDSDEKSVKLDKNLHIHPAQDVYMALIESISKFSMQKKKKDAYVEVKNNSEGSKNTLLKNLKKNSANIEVYFDVDQGKPEGHFTREQLSDFVQPQYGG